MNVWSFSLKKNHNNQNQNEGKFKQTEECMEAINVDKYNNKTIHL